MNFIEPFIFRKIRSETASLKHLELGSKSLARR